MEDYQKITPQDTNLKSEPGINENKVNLDIFGRGGGGVKFYTGFYNGKLATWSVAFTWIWFKPSSIQVHWGLSVNINTTYCNGAAFIDSNWSVVENYSSHNENAFVSGNNTYLMSTLDQSWPNRLKFNLESFDSDGFTIDVEQSDVNAKFTYILIG